MYYTSLRKHEFFRGINFETLPEMTPPSVGMLPEVPDGPDPCWKRCLDAKPGAERIPFLVTPFEPSTISLVLLIASGRRIQAGHQILKKHPITGVKV